MISREPDELKWSYELPVARVLSGSGEEFSLSAATSSGWYESMLARKAVYSQDHHTGDGNCTRE